MKISSSLGEPNSAGMDGEVLSWASELNFFFGGGGGCDGEVLSWTNELKMSFS